MSTIPTAEVSFENKILGPGADLWVLPALAESSWVARIEWFCNMQLSKNSLHNTQEVPDTLKVILQECELPLYKFDEHLNTETLQKVLIPSEKWFPNRWLLSLPYKEKDPWAKAIETTWIQLKKPSIRIFLPTQLNKSTATTLFKFLPDLNDETLISDKD